MSLPPPIEPQLDLLPVDHPNWEWERFERFCLALVKAQPDVKNASRYGKQGEKQRGIDIAAELVDSRKRTYQCRQRKRFTKRDAERLVQETAYQADEHMILVTCEVGTKVRDYIDTLPNWTLWDKEDIAQEVRAIEPRERGRRLVEDAFGVAYRRAFLGPRSSRAFFTSDELFEPFLHKDRLFRHDWRLVGRESVLRELRNAIESPEVRIAVVVGRGGIGKTRLLRAISEEDDDSPRQVLFVREGAELDDEEVDEVPFADTVIVLDDAHRRSPNELMPLLSMARRRDHRLAIVLATRPQRIDELRGELARAGFNADEIWASEPLDALSRPEVEDLARQALSVNLAHLAPELARATLDCPLVTVIGGQLLASEALPPTLLERHDAFRAQVLDRFTEERLGHLKPDVDPDVARKALSLLSALQPISVADEQTLEKLAADAGTDVPGLKTLLGELEDAGIVLARGRFRRVIPDVLADHILHRYCIDLQGRSTGRADKLLDRYGDTVLAPLLRNLSELDWRAGQAGEPADLLGKVWADLSTAFHKANAEGRMGIAALIKPVAFFQPRRVLELVEFEIQNPAATVDHGWGVPITDEHVREKLPELLRSIAYSPAYTERAMELLWELGRDDARELHPHPSHPIRVLQELGSYQHPLFFGNELLALTTKLLNADSTHHWSPLRLITPLLSREGMTTLSEGYAIRTEPYHVNPTTTAELRARVRELLRDQTLKGDDRSQYIAADILGDGLSQPHGYFGQSVPEDIRDGWLPDQEATLGAIEEVFQTTNDPTVRVLLRDKLQWHAEHSAWPTIRDRCQAVLEKPLDDAEQIITVMAYPWPVLIDNDERKARTNDAAAKLVAMPSEEAVRFVETSLNHLAVVGANADPGQILHAMAEKSPDHAEAMARQALGDPTSRLGGALPLLLNTLQPSSPATHARILAEMCSKPEFRPGVASYIADRASTDFTQQETELMQNLLTDPAPHVVQIALIGVMRLATASPQQARELVLIARVDDQSESAERLCACVTHSEVSLSRGDRSAILSKIESVPDLDYHVRAFLVETSKTDAELSIDFLLKRISQPRQDDFRAVPFDNFEGSLLASGDDGTHLLRKVRDRLATATGIQELEVVRLFWKLNRDMSEHLLVMHEWLSSDDPDKVERASALLGKMPWGSLLGRPMFVSDVLERGAKFGGTALENVKSGLASAATQGDHSRTMGKPAPRDLTTVEEATEAMEHFPPASLGHLFFKHMRDTAEDRIRESRLEDEEIGES
jgi:hypothetical protein